MYYIQTIFNYFFKIVPDKILYSTIPYQLSSPHTALDIVSSSF